MALWRFFLTAFWSETSNYFSLMRKSVRNLMKLHTAGKVISLFECEWRWMANSMALCYPTCSRVEKVFWKTNLTIVVPTTSSRLDVNGLIRKATTGRFASIPHLFLSRTGRVLFCLSINIKKTALCSVQTEQCCVSLRVCVLSYCKISHKCFRGQYYQARD